jgi:hypothetical protein
MRRGLAGGDDLTLEVERAKQPFGACACRGIGFEEPSRRNARCSGRRADARRPGERRGTDGIGKPSRRRLVEPHSSCASRSSGFASSRRVTSSTRPRESAMKSWTLVEKRSSLDGRADANESAMTSTRSAASRRRAVCRRFLTVVTAGRARALQPPRTRHVPRPGRAACPSFLLRANRVRGFPNARLGR